MSNIFVSFHLFRSFIYLFVCFVWWRRYAHSFKCKETGESKSRRRLLLLLVCNKNVNTLGGCFSFVYFLFWFCRFKETKKKQMKENRRHFKWITIPLSLAFFLDHFINLTILLFLLLIGCGIFIFFFFWLYRI